MFKQANRVWWYMLGALIMMILLMLVGRDYIIPLLTGQRGLLNAGPYTYTSAPAFTIDTKVDYAARLDTSLGVVTIDLFEQSAPQNVNSFVFLANQKYYNGTNFHRLIQDLLVQGGDRNTLTADVSIYGRGGPGYFIQDEVNWDSLNLSSTKRKALTDKGYSSVPDLFSHHLEKYSLAMASSLPNTIGSQFFIVLADSIDTRIQEMDGYFTVIGTVTAGTNVLDDINHTQVDNPQSDVPHPVQPIVLNQVEIFTK